MKKTEAVDALSRALDIIQEAGTTPRLIAARKAELLEFVETTRKAITEEATTATGYTWRIAEVINPKSGKLISVDVKKNGALFPADIKRGLPAPKTWTEVKAATRGEAREKIGRGEGQSYEVAKGKKAQPKTVEPAAAESAPQPAVPTEG